MTYTTTPKVSYTHLTSKNRVELAVLLRAKLKQKDIARQLGKDPSVISREIKRNSKNGKYLAIYARRKTEARRLSANKRFRKIDNNPELKRYTVAKLKKYWSPEQIAGRMSGRHDRITICHETIYQYIYKHRPDLKKYLRCQKGKYRRRYGTKLREKAREEARKKRIDTRPLIVDQRLRIGDWEGDTIVGVGHCGSILTYVERKTGYAFADKLDRLSAKDLASKTKSRFEKIPKNKRYTITYDNGPECWGGEEVESAMGISVYYAYPYRSWERGCNENWNGLLRQFFPKKISLANIQQEEIEKAVHLINTRPRKRLSYLTPEEVFKDKNCILD